MSPDARADVRDARDWYEGQQRGLGSRFLQALVEALDAVALRPDSFAPIYADVRRAILKKFPYGVFFRRQGTDVIFVIAVVHLRRDPNVWRKRV